jgi:hypothetical protein
MPSLLKSKLTIEEKNGDLLALIHHARESIGVSRLVRKKEDAHSRIDRITLLTRSFEIRCLERLYVFMKLATENCFAGYPVVATLLARGVIETAGLLILFENKVVSGPLEGTRERAERLKRFVFASRKFGPDKKAVHVMDCVRALKPYDSEIEDLYELLCESVHPNWLGVSQFSEFERADRKLNEYDTSMYTMIFRALLLGHKVIEGVGLVGQRTDLSSGMGRA